jgi:RNA polymerase sigma-70 factor (ECF subfamily)
MSPDPSPAGAPLDSTAVLLDRWKAGDEAAREALFVRYLPLLTRWAHGRIPTRARSLADTGDLVQVTLLRALNHLHEFDCRREGALLAYLRRGLLNAIRDQIRRAAVRAPAGIEPDALVSGERSPLEQVMGRDVIESYEAALARLPAEQQEAVLMRLEFGYGWPEIATALGKPSPNAARMLVSRALARIAEDMHAHRR